MKPIRVATVLLGLAVIALLIVLDRWIFTRFFEENYLEWFVAQGALIGFATSIGASLWGDLSERLELTSAHPLDYLGACMQFVGMPIQLMGDDLVEGSREPGLWADRLVSKLAILVMVVALLVWLVVIAPLQYFVFLICGAPGRYLAHSRRQTIVEIFQKQVAVKRIPRGEEAPKGWSVVGLTEKPLALTGLCSSAFFLVVNWIGV